MKTHQYNHNKVKTALSIFKNIENWPEGLALRLNRSQKVDRLLRFKNGLAMLCRGGTRDWDVLHELFFEDGYARAFHYLKDLGDREGVVLDLGGNIGSFSLLAALNTAPAVEIHAYEPGPENARVFQINTLVNPHLRSPIFLHQVAVGGKDGEASWFFDADNPGGSSLYAKSGTATTVKLASFSGVVAALKKPVLLAKIDIEGSEFDLLENTPAATWSGIPAIALELHDDPAGRTSQKAFLEKFAALGYTIEKEAVISYFLRRK